MGWISAPKLTGWGAPGASFAPEAVKAKAIRATAPATTRISGHLHRLGEGIAPRDRAEGDGGAEGCASAPVTAASGRGDAISRPEQPWDRLALGINDRAWVL